MLIMEVSYEGTVPEIDHGHHFCSPKQAVFWTSPWDERFYLTIEVDELSERGLFGVYANDYN